MKAVLMRGSAEAGEQSSVTFPRGEDPLKSEIPIRKQNRSEKPLLQLRPHGTLT